MPGSRVARRVENRCWVGEARVGGSRDPRYSRTRRLATFLVPIGLLIALVNTKLARADVAALLVRLRNADIGELQTSLAKLLRDPTLRIAQEVSQDDHHKLTDLTDLTDLGDGYVLLHHHSARTKTRSCSRLVSQRPG